MKHVWNVSLFVFVWTIALESVIKVNAAVLACDPTTTENTIIHAGDAANDDDLAILLAANPTDGYLGWAVSKISNYENSLYIPSTGDACEGIGFHWTIDSKEENITIAAAFLIEEDGVGGEKAGWGAIGFSETGGMRGADVVYFQSSSSSLVDAHILDLLAKPIPDANQDWTLLNQTVTDDGYLIFEAKRALDTGDAFDRAFINDSPTYVEDPKLIAAWGSSTDVSYHGNKRLRTSIQLFESVEGDTSPGLDYDLFLVEMQERSDSFTDLKISYFEIPRDSTYYHEECFSTSDLISLGLLSNPNSVISIIGYEFQIQPANLKYMHHIVLYGHYDNTGCSQTRRSPVFVWTPGEEYLYFPHGAGIKFGGPGGFVSFTMQYHVDNSDRDGNKVDTGSGIRLYTTVTPVTTEIGMMQIGDPFLGLQGQPVGDGLMRHVLECPSSCTTNNFQNEMITIVKESLHMHSNGKRIVNQVVRNDKVIHEGYIDYWDFDQSGTPAPQQEPFSVRKGDKFRTICYFDSNPSMIFSSGSSDEMCMAFLLYYPKQSMETCSVDFDPDPSCSTNYLGKTKLDDISQIGRVFGNKENRCSSDGYTEVALGSSITMRYKSNISTLTVEMKTDRKAWLSLGINSEGLMLDSDAIIGFPSLGVAKYRLENTKSHGGVNLMEEERQTLIETSFVQDENGSMMTFTKLLEDGSDMMIPSEGHTTFIYALGNGNSLPSGHIYSGSIKLPLGSCPSINDIDTSSGNTKFEKILAIHGLIAALTFGLLVPIAICASRLRKYLEWKLVGGKEIWFIIHSFLNCTSYILITIVFALAIYAKNGVKGEHFQHSHEVVGLIIFILMTIQVVGGVLRPQDDTKRIYAVVIDHNPSPYVNTVSRRQKWKKFHLVGGIITFILSIYQIITGLQKYREIFDKTILDSL